MKTTELINRAQQSAVDDAQRAIDRAKAIAAHLIELAEKRNTICDVTISGYIADAASLAGLTVCGGAVSPDGLTRVLYVGFDNEYHNI